VARGWRKGDGKPRKTQAQRSRESYERHADRRREAGRRSRRDYIARIKVAILTYYSVGTPCCARCGERDVDVLCVDHINDNGAAFRRGSRRRGGIEQYVNLPEGCQVLCANCNLKKEIERRRALVA
jgi:hypothetical protein